MRSRAHRPDPRYSSVSQDAESGVTVGARRGTINAVRRPGRRRAAQTRVRNHVGHNNITSLLVGSLHSGGRYLTFHMTPTSNHTGVVPLCLRVSVRKRRLI